MSLNLAQLSSLSKSLSGSVASAVSTVVSAASKSASAAISSASKAASDAASAASKAVSSALSSATKAATKAKDEVAKTVTKAREYVEDNARETTLSVISPVEGAVGVVSGAIGATSGAAQSAYDSAAEYVSNTQAILDSINAVADIRGEISKTDAALAASLPSFDYVTSAAKAPIAAAELAIPDDLKEMLNGLEGLPAEIMQGVTALVKSVYVLPALLSAYMRSSFDAWVNDFLAGMSENTTPDLKPFEAQAQAVAAQFKGVS